ncbi:MAG: polysaccharide deacetylase family protein, partial [Bacteroidota bacterium]
DFYRTPQFEGLIEKIKAEGHYLGAHSDKHLLYCGWYKRDSTLISKDDFRNDVLNNYSEMEKYGINSEAAKYFIPPFEWYNNEISNWCEELGIKIVNFTQATISNADYTVPSMKNYKSSKQIYESIIDYEKRNNLNGFILLTHIGAHPERIDKFYNQLNSLVEYLLNEGYSFKQIDEAVKTE